jgi:hypothetical protein
VNSEKYIGLDVHQATISIAVLDSSGKLVMESIVETKAATLLQFLAGLRGSLHVTLEEGTWAALWVFNCKVLKPKGLDDWRPSELLNSTATANGMTASSYCYSRQTHYKNFRLLPVDSAVLWRYANYSGHGLVFNSAGPAYDPD